MPPDSPGLGCQLGVIFALPLEAHAFEGLVTGSRLYHVAGLTIATGSLAGQQVVWTVCGVGEAAAGRAARLLCDGHDPHWLVSAGFAGGLNPDLTRGQLIMPAHIVAEAHPQQPPHPVEATLAARFWQQHPPANTTLISVDGIVANPAAKAALRQATAADLVDMESWAVATVAETTGRGFLSLRVISDTAAEALPREVTRLSQPLSQLRRLGTALGAIARRPGAAVDFWHLWERGLAQSQRLASGLVDIIAASSEQP